MKNVIKYDESCNKIYEREYINRFKFGNGILYHKNGNKYFDGEFKECLCSGILR
jgi:hypothetical protein